MELIDYAEIYDEASTNLLLGNGFSIGWRETFRYNSLKDIASSQGFLSPRDLRLFDDFETCDFEFLLSKLSEAVAVNKALGIDYQTPYRHYEGIRSGLINSLRLVHPEASELAQDLLRAAAGFLREYECVFTTNYDLLLYWIAGSIDFQGFADYFWGPGLTFDSLNTDIFGDKTQLIYLHGALFLFSEDGVPRKVRTTAGDSLLASLGNWGKVPLFVSEGSSEAKYRAIQNDSYLHFAYERLLGAKSGITIFGHSLSPADNHIARALDQNHELDVVACAINDEGKTAEEVADKILSLKKLLLRFQGRGGELQFFRSSTFPIARMLQDPSWFRANLRGRTGGFAGHPLAYPAVVPGAFSTVLASEN